MIDSTIYKAIKQITQLKKSNVISKVIIVGILAGISVGLMVSFERNLAYNRNEAKFLKTFLPLPEIAKEAEACAQGNITAYSSCEEKVTQTYKVKFATTYNPSLEVNALKDHEYMLLWLIYYVVMFVAISRIFRFELLYLLDDEFQNGLASCIITLASDLQEIVDDREELGVIETKQLVELEAVLSSFNTKNYIMLDAIKQYKESYYAMQSYKLNTLYEVE